jgi:hypothetical protein
MPLHRTPQPLLPPLDTGPPAVATARLVPMDRLVPPMGHLVPPMGHLVPPMGRLVPPMGHPVPPTAPVAQADRTVQAPDTRG